MESMGYRLPFLQKPNLEILHQKNLPILPPLIPTNQENCLHTFEIESLNNSHSIDLQNIYANI